MRRRAPDEHIEPYRARIHEPEGWKLRAMLADWTATVAEQLTGYWPQMPSGVTDRPADVWEPLLAVADAAGGPWPGRARDACAWLVKDNAERGIRSVTRRVGCRDPWLRCAGRLVQVARFQGRALLRDGYHRAYGFLSRGITHVPAFVRTMQTIGEVVPQGFSCPSTPTWVIDHRC
jgi:hypothetical protein